MYQPRTYRKMVNSDLCTYRVQIAESDLLISSDINLKDYAYDMLKNLLSEVEGYILQDREFLLTRTKYKPLEDAPEIIVKMAKVTAVWDVGPMATVAGTIAEEIGRELSKLNETVIIENGGDIYAKSTKPVSVLLYAGESSPFTGNICFEVDSSEGIGICTSSGTYGHSFSYGKADAVIAISSDACFADAAATSIANKVMSADDLYKVIEFEKQRDFLKGLIICMENQIAFLGDIKLKSNS